LKRVNLLLFLVILLICGFLTACNQEKPYEVIETNSKVTEEDDRLQLELEYEIVNNSDEDYYYTFVFPSYIQDALITKVGGVGKISANSSISGVAVIAVSKDGAEMTKETIKGILNGELPIVNQILIGKTINLN
jgi:hypothetical protein